MCVIYFFFFFQAEDGIRDADVTGVQTCALPIYADAACPPRPDYSQGYVWALYDYDLYSAAADGAGAQRLTTNPEYDAEGTLSPDGRTIVFTSLLDGDLDIYTMGVDRRDVRRLTTTLGYAGGPFFSPDGKLIVYRAY